jgi:hypothetical protein
LIESHKLDPWRFDENPRPKCDNLKLTYMASFWKENELVHTPKKELKRRAHDLENKDAN